MDEVVIVGVGGLESRIQQGNVDEPMGSIAFGPHILLPEHSTVPYVPGQYLYQA